MNDMRAGQDEYVMGREGGKEGERGERERKGEREKGMERGGVWS